MRYHFPVKGENGEESPHFIELPDKWLTSHATRHFQATEKSIEAGLVGVAHNFAVSIALLEDWNLPGLNGNPDKWDFQAIDLVIAGWVNGLVLPAYYDNFQIKKKS